MFTFGKNIPISILPGFWLLILALSMSGGQGIAGILILIPVVLFSLVAHELGHALTARYFGQNAFIQISFFGGVTYRTGSSVGLLREFLIVLMGPLASIGIVLVSQIILKTSLAQTWIGPVFFLTFVINIFWTILNLIPVYPLDGGKLLSIALIAFFPNSGRKWSYLMSAGFAFVVSVFFFISGYLFAGGIFLLCLWESVTAFRTIRDEGENHSYAHALEELEELAKSGKVYQAIDGLKAFLLNNAPKAVLGKAYAQLAKLQLLQEDPQEAYMTISAAEERIKGMSIYELLTLKQLAGYRTSRFQQSLVAGKEAFRIRPDISTALLLSMTAAQLHDIPETIHWLESCRSLGFTDFIKLCECSDFDSVRYSPEFEAFSSRVLSSEK